MAAPVSFSSLRTKYPGSRGWRRCWAPSVTGGTSTRRPSGDLARGGVLEDDEGHLRVEVRCACRRVEPVGVGHSLCVEDAAVVAEKASVRPTRIFTGFIALDARRWRRLPVHSCCTYFSSAATMTYRSSSSY